MNRNTLPSRAGPWLARLLSGALALSMLLGLHACGGGGVEGQGTGTFGYSQGPITGFGSIVVNGIHFDETTAAVTSEDGATLSAAGLKLGMTVEVDSGAINQTTATAVASQVRLRSDLLGPVSANNLAAATLTVLGQTVKITPSTVFDDRLAGGQAAVAVGRLVEIYAIYDPVAGVYAARRIEPVTSATQFRIRGQVAALDTTAKTFRIGSAVLAYTTADASLVNGAIVKIRVRPTRDGLGRWVVSDASQGTRQPAEGTEVEIEGVIASYTSRASFTVAGLSVDASGARLNPAGATLAAGVRVEVEGTMRSGVLVADKVELKSAEDSGSDGGGVEYELQGKITAIDTTAKTFLLRGVSVYYGGSVAYKDGVAADLKVDAKVEVKGLLSSDGTRVEASEIQFDN